MSNLFYNRDRNISGVPELTGINISPSYGSSVSFTTRTSEVKFPNRVLSRMGQSLNSVIAEYNLIFRIQDDEASQVLDYLESRSGVLPVAINDSSNIYKPISGFADNFSWNAKTNSENEITARIVIDNRSPKLNWSGLCFVNQEFKQWSSGEFVPENAIRYFEADNQNKFNNFFYCTGAHNSDISNAPFSTGSMWTQNLFLDQSFEYTISTKPDVSKIEFANSFYQRNYDKKNIHSIENLVLRFRGISDEKTRALLHFAESKFGELKFVYKIPKIYNKEKIFFCPSWRHTWVYKNCNDVELDLIEDPLGVLPQNNSPCIVINQRSDQSYIDYSFVSRNNFGLISYGGEDKIVSADGKIIKNWENGTQSVSLFGSVTGVFSQGQRIQSVALSDRSPIISLSLPGNTISQIALNEARKLEYLDLTSNSLETLSTDNITGLKTLKIANNRIAELDISSNNALTGLYCSGNKLSSAQINNCLDALVNFRKYSGVFDIADGDYPDFESNDSISGAGFDNINALGWRGWTINADNAKIPLDVSGYSFPVCHFKQESITGFTNGQSIFSWDDSVANRDASRFTVSDSLRPRLDEGELNARPALYFNGNSYLEQTAIVSLPQNYAIFAVVKPASSGYMTVFSDYFNRGLAISGNRLYSKTNQGNTFFGELSGDSYNVVGIYGGASGVMTGAVNTQTPSTGLKIGSSNLSLPGSIGVNRYGDILVTGHSGQVAGPFIGHISEVLVTSGIVNFPMIMRDLGAKHGLEII